MSEMRDMLQPSLLYLSYVSVRIGSSETCCSRRMLHLRRRLSIISWWLFSVVSSKAFLTTDCNAMLQSFPCHAQHTFFFPLSLDHFLMRHWKASPVVSIALTFFLRPNFMCKGGNNLTDVCKFWIHNILTGVCKSWIHTSLCLHVLDLHILTCVYKSWIHTSLLVSEVLDPQCPYWCLKVLDPHILTGV
ncbi:hypothetical protein BsWGS_24399 [Bradybaena similaris]